jgi:peptidoglycan/LPS O-acetylase OafA/YrhL
MTDLVSSRPLDVAVLEKAWPPLIGRPQRLVTYHPALDGIRAFSIAAVFADHASYGFYEGGMIGVDVFFALSGFLITRVLLADLRTFGRIDFRGFYIRRVRRLAPALIATLLLSWASWPWTSKGTPFVPAALASLFYYANWKACFAPASMGALSQMWSLSVEEQFYLGWPLSLAALVGWLNRHRRPVLGSVVWIAVVLAGTAALLRALLFLHGSPVGNYYSTLARIDVILIGCACALALEAGQVTAVFAGRVGASIAWIGAGCIVLISVSVNQQSPFLYLGGLSLIGLAAGSMLLHVTTASSSAMARLLSANMLVQIGKRSYGIYLYHGILCLLVEPLRVPHSLGNFVWVLGLRMAITLTVAWLSYRFIESPFLSGRADVVVRPTRFSPSPTHTPSAA